MIGDTFTLPCHPHEIRIFPFHVQGNKDTFDAGLWCFAEDFGNDYICLPPFPCKHDACDLYGWGWLREGLFRGNRVFFRGDKSRSFPVMRLPGPAGPRARTPSCSQAGTVSCAVSSLPRDQTGVGRYSVSAAGVAKPAGPGDPPGAGRAMPRTFLIGIASARAGGNGAWI